MEAINARLRQLEGIETALYLQQRTAVQSRTRDDEQLRIKREEEDGNFLRVLKERDAEEDGLREQRRTLARSSLPNMPVMLSTSMPRRVGPITRSKTKAKRVVGSAATKPKAKNVGLPTTHDSQGRPLYTRSSDGKLMYLRCSVAGCGRGTFNTVLALRRHICNPNHSHKLSVMFTSNDHAIELFGEVAPGQEDFHDDVGLQPSMAAKVASMASIMHENLTSPTTDYETEGALSVMSGSHTLVDSDRHWTTPQEATRVTDRDRPNQASTTQPRRETETRRRAQQAAQRFDNVLDSYSEDSDSDEDDFAGHPTADKINQHRAAGLKATKPDRSITGNELFDICCEIKQQETIDLAQASVDQGVNMERDESRSLFLEQSEKHRSPERFATPAHVALNQSLATAANAKQPSGDGDGDGEIVVAWKRAASARPCTPVSCSKRLRITEGPGTI